MNEYIGAPRPRVLTIGLTDSEVELLRPLAGSLVVTESMQSVHTEEHDVLIHAGADFSTGSGLFARRIAFARAVELEAYSTVFAHGEGNIFTRSSTSSETQRYPAHSFEITPFARENALESLVRRSCWPVEGQPYTGFKTPVYPERVEHTLIHERLKNPYVIAAILEKIDDDEGNVQDSAFWLPDIARTALEDWVRTAFSRWRLASPEVFPQTAEWHQADEWSAPAEHAARRSLAEFESAEAERKSVADAARRELTSAIKASEAEGEAWRELVSASGDELVRAVQQSLESFGFEVINSDKLPEHKGRKREDLRVTHEGWTALVEVKGYAGSAKSNDLLQLTSASSAFAATEQTTPDALWYVVNVYRSIDPAQREIALPGRDDDLAVFAASHSGLLLDTRELFTLRQLVVNGLLTPADARGALKNSAPRFRSAEVMPRKISDVSPQHGN